MNRGNGSERHDLRLKFHGKTTKRQFGGALSTRTAERVEASFISMATPLNQGPPIQDLAPKGGYPSVSLYVLVVALIRQHRGIRESDYTFWASPAVAV